MMSGILRYKVPVLGSCAPLGLEVWGADPGAARRQTAVAACPRLSPLAPLGGSEQPSGQKKAPACPEEAKGFDKERPPLAPEPGG